MMNVFSRLGLAVLLSVGMASPGVNAQQATPPPARAVLPLPAGPSFQGSIRTRDRLVPLPPGQWVELGRGTWVGGARSADFSFEEVGLGRVTAGRVDALAIVHTTNYEGGISVRTWGPSPVCGRTDTLFVLVNSADERNQSCMLLNHVVGSNSAQGSPFWTRYNALREGQQQLFPATMISTAYRMSGGTRATTVTYLFGVERHGFPVSRTSWESSPWHRGRATGDRAALIERYKAWMTANFESVRRGVEDGRAGTLTAPP